MKETITGNGGLRLHSLLFLSFIIVLLDQLTKYLCNTNMLLGELVPVFPGFDLLLVYNYGAAFSFLNDAGGWQRWFLTTVSFVLSGVFIVWIIRLPKSEVLQRIALAIILGGAVGNLIDRFLVGFVIDFLSVYYRDYRFATFNLADSAISIGAVLLIIDMFINTKEEERK